MVLRWRHSELDWFDFFEREAIRFFAQVWHRCSRDGPDPLPATGPAILIANHPSQADPAFLIAICKRPPQFLQAQEYYQVFGLRCLFARLGYIPVARDGHDVSAVRLALRRLREGSILGIFLEGDLTAACKRRNEEATAGAALLALRARVPVFPAYIAGGPQGRSLLQAWLWPSPGVRVIYGDPIDLSGYLGRPLTHQMLHEVTALLMQRIEKLQPASRKEAVRQPASGN
jgi:1-acyl-sn-glycerol-3-phosphate acyltransferase